MIFLKNYASLNKQVLFFARKVDFTYKAVVIVALLLCNMQLMAAAKLSEKDKFFATIASTADGDWDDPTTWGGGNIPTAADNILLLHNVTVTDNTLPSVAKSIKVMIGSASVTVTGTDVTLVIGSGGIEYAGGSVIVNNGADLTINGPVLIENANSTNDAELVAYGTGTTVSITGDVSLTANNFDSRVSLDIYDNADVTINGNVSMLDQNPNIQNLRLRVDTGIISDHSTLSITGDLNFERDETGDPGDFIEIQIGYKTAGSYAELNVGGTINLFLNNPTDNNRLNMWVENNSVVTTNNLTLTSENDNNTTTDLDIQVSDNAAFYVLGTTTYNYNLDAADLINGAASNTLNASHEIIIDVTNSATFSTNNLTMNDTDPTGGQDNWLRADTNGTIDINGTITFSSTAGEVGNEIELDNSSILTFSGSTVVNPDQGRVEFEGTPAGTSGTLIMDGSGNQDLIRAKDDIYNNLTISNSSTTSLINANDIINIYGTLTLTSGILSLNGFVSTITDIGLISGGSTSSYIQGGQVVVVGDTPASNTIPVGGNGNYGPVDITINSTTGVPEVTVEYFGSSYSNLVASWLDGIISEHEYWNITAINTTDTDFSINWSDNTYSGIDDIGISPQDLIMAGYNTGNVNWDNLGGTISGTLPTGKITLSNVDLSTFAYSTFTFGGAGDVRNSALPVELVSFQASVVDDKNLIDWVTAAELNNDHFDLEKSSDGTSFKLLSTVQGAGNSNEVNKYSVYDDTPYQPVTYYRLKQVDFDGLSSYSKVISVYYKRSAGKSFYLYPNPVNGDKAFLRFVSDSYNNGEKFIIKIYDMKGTKLADKTVDATIDNQIEVDFSEIEIYGSTPVMLQINMGKHQYSELVYFN